MRLGPAGVGVVVAALALVGPAIAQIVPCRGLATTDPFKVLLDDLDRTQVVSGDQGGNDLVNRLRDVLRSRMAVLMTGSAPFEVLQCVGRKPTNEGEFDDALVSSLNTRNVVLEVWGTLDARNVAGQVRDRHMRIKYLIIPMRGASRVSPSVSGVFEATYPKSTSTQSEDYLKLFEQAKEIEAYVALGVGIKSLRARNYGVARQYLCRAGHLMQDAWAGTSLGDGERSLIEYVRGSAAEALNGALGGRILGQDTSCPTGTP